ncbi:hypothetical protein NY78_1362 [Desulfovibrio sp. TomC]|nr:hypothetical protein NY78_1362 [Desulfovibrio sp. TomC]
MAGGGDAARRPGLIAGVWLPGSGRPGPAGRVRQAGSGRPSGPDNLPDRTAAWLSPREAHRRFRGPANLPDRAAV